VTEDEHGGPGPPNPARGPGEGEGATDRARQGRTVFELGTDGPKIIVAGVDGSDSSWRAASYAAGLARRQGALLALVYVQPVAVSPSAGVMGVMAETTAQIAEEIVGQAREDTEKLGDVFPMRWEFHTLHGDPYTGLVRTANDLRADAVVVGASEQAGHRFIGSLAVRLVKAARWPVTVVP
jgi:nucleotide-binding universal stress UspA family protein